MGNNDLAIFCDGIRFWGVQWGLHSVAGGLREAGFEGRIIYWSWNAKHSGRGGHSSLPALWDVALQTEHAKRIAARIAKHRKRYPDATIYLLGCSAGGGVAVRAAEYLTEDAWIDGLVLLSVAVNPHPDLTQASAHVRGPILNFSSCLDVMILGLGTTLFGTTDRRRGVSAGMIGFRGPQPASLKSIPWRPWMTRFHRMGGHHSAMKRRFITGVVAPEMGITPQVPSTYDE
jgi:pimeloyl-ACP methyl ester carboxylesterase